MSKVDRNNPKRSTASESSYSLMEFMREFPDDAACLEWLWRARLSDDGRHAECPKCERERAFYRVASRPSYCCDTCGHHLHPTAGTIFHKSATSLHLWFYVMYLMTSTRCGISAKQVEREIGVTYKTAWRMCNLIRNYLMDQDGDEPLSGHVEVDETAWGGKPKASMGLTRQTAQEWRKRKATIMGMVEREGRIRAVHVSDRDGTTALGTVVQFVLPEARIYTDDWAGYRRVGDHFSEHYTVDHSAKVYVSGHVHTQTIEGWFGNTKRGISGVYHSISHKWLQGYLNEYAWRYNHRQQSSAMFRVILFRAASVAK
jgi:transposase